MTGEDYLFEAEVLNVFDQVEMNSLIEKLPSPQKEIVVLRYYSRLNATQIGQMMEMEPSTVRYHLSQGIKKMKVSLE